MLRDTSAASKRGRGERHWPRPRLSDLLVSHSFRSCCRKPTHKPREEEDCTAPLPRRPGETGASASDYAVTGASTRGSRSDPKGSGKQLLPVCLKKKMLSIFFPWFSVMHVVTGVKPDSSSLCKRKQTHQWAYCAHRHPGWGGEVPSSPSLVTFQEAIHFGKQTFTHSVFLETSLMGKTPPQSPWKLG